MVKTAEFVSVSIPLSSEGDCFRSVRKGWARFDNPGPADIVKGSLQARRFTRIPGSRGNDEGMTEVRMTTTEQRPSSDYKVVGTRPIRHDGIDKVTGAAKYGADIQLAGMLHGKVLRSPHAHARIRSIDTSRAEALPGVLGVVTAKDFPIIQDQVIDLAETQGNVRLMAEHVMANEKALYQGHAVAAVAATSPHIAEQALALLDVDYEVLEPVLSLEEAMRPDAPVIHETLSTHFKQERFARGEDTGARGNIASHIQHKLGDVEKGFGEADVVLEREYQTGTVHQGYIEPHASTATWSGDGRLDRVDLHAGLLRHPQLHRRHVRGARGHGAGDSHGNRRRVRGENHHLP